MHLVQKYGIMFETFAAGVHPVPNSDWLAIVRSHPHPAAGGGGVIGSGVLAMVFAGITAALYLAGGMIYRKHRHGASGMYVSNATRWLHAP